LTEADPRSSEQESTISRWSTRPALIYWDHTQLRFPRREGMRIDFVLTSPALTRRVSGASIDREERKGKGLSDHAPSSSSWPTSGRLGVLAAHLGHTGHWLGRSGDQPARDQSPGH
jgi:hypothetical protein